MVKKGDSDPKAYIIALIGGAIGALLGSRVTVGLCALVPVFIYQLGLDIPKHAAGLGDSQAEQGFTRFFVALFASMVPGVCGMFVGQIVLMLIHGADI